MAFAVQNPLSLSLEIWEAFPACNAACSVPRTCTSSLLFSASELASDFAPPPPALTMSPTAMTFLIFLVLTFTTTSTSATFIPQTPTGYFARLPANLTADYNPPLNIYQKNEFLYTDCHPHQFFSWRLVSEPTSGRLYKQLFSPVNCEPYTTYMPSHRDDYIRVTMAYFNVSGHIIEVHMPEEYTSSKRPVTDGIELVSSFYLKDDVLYDLAQSLGILEYGGRLTFAMEYFSITKNDPMEEEEETTKEESSVLTLKPMFSHA